MSTDDTDVMEETVTESVEENTGLQTTAELQELKEQVAQQSNALSQLVNALKQPQENKKVDQNRLAELAKDPVAAAAYIQSVIAEGKNEIVRESQKEINDRKAEQDFPVLKTDQKFRSEVLKQMNEFIKTGEYAPNSPMLTYRAAQIVAGKLKASQSEGRKTTSSGLTSEAPSTRSKTTTQQSQSKIPDSDPRVVFAKALGITDSKRLDKFKSELDGPYVPKARQRARSLVK